MKKYDVLQEKWINVRYIDGHYEKLSLKETLLQAHKIRELVEVESTYEYGVFRVLCAFIMDMYRPKNTGSIQILLMNGKIEENVFQDYIEICLKEGVSFNLFDEKRPFLQTPYDPQYDKNTTSVAKLNVTLPSGNNHIHFDHRLESEQEMEIDEALRGLCALRTFCTAGAQNYPSSINGAPPLFFVFNGDSLFESLVLSCISEDQAKAENLKYADPPVMWRRTDPVIPKKKSTTISVLAGMVYPCRRVLLIPEEDQKIRQIYLSQGIDYIAYDSWMDPHVSYLYSDKGRTSIKPTPGEEPWRNIGTIISTDKGAPVFVRSLVKKHLKDNIVLKTYGVTTKQANYLDSMASQLTMPCSIAEDELKTSCVLNVLHIIETQWIALISVCKTWIHDTSILEEMQHNYYSKNKEYLLGPVFNDLSILKESDVLDHLKIYKKELCKICMDTFYETMSEYVSSTQDLVKQQKAKTKLIKRIYRKEETDDES